MIYVFVNHKIFTNVCFHDFRFSKQNGKNTLVEILRFTKTVFIFVFVFAILVRLALNLAENAMNRCDTFNCR